MKRLSFCLKDEIFKTLQLQNEKFLPNLKQCLYFLPSGYRVLLGVIPNEEERIRQMMEDLGLNPDDNREDFNTPVGIGNLCGNNVVRDHLDDGINQVSKMNKLIITT